mgnify:CR=1 FL=1
MPKEGVLVQEGLLVDFVKILKPLANRISAITGDFAYGLDEDIHVVRIKGNASESFPSSVSRFILA